MKKKKPPGTKPKRARKPTTPARFMKELAALADKTTSNEAFLENGLANAISGICAELRMRPIAQEYGFRGILVTEMTIILDEHSIEGSPPTRNSVDRWLDGISIPSLHRYLLLATAFGNLEAKAKSRTFGKKEFWHEYYAERLEQASGERGVYYKFKNQKS